MLARRTMVREVFLVLQKGVEVPSCCERDILRYEKGTEMDYGLEGFGTAKGYPAGFDPVTRA